MSSKSQQVASNIIPFKTSALFCANCGMMLRL